MAGVTATGSFGEPLCDHIGHQIPAIGVAALAPSVKAHGLDDVAAFVGDDVSGAQVVGVDERFIRLALLLEAAAGFNGVNGTGHGSAPGDGVAVARLDAFDVAQVAGGFGDRDAVLFELVGATEAVAARAVLKPAGVFAFGDLNRFVVGVVHQGPKGAADLVAVGVVGVVVIASLGHRVGPSVCTVGVLPHVVFVGDVAQTVVAYVLLACA